MIVILTDKQLNQILQHFGDKEKLIMTVIDDLNTAIAALANDVNACIDNLKAEAANAVSAQNTQIEAAIATVNTLDAAVKAADPGLQA